jgi:transposase
MTGGFGVWEFYESDFRRAVERGYTLGELVEAFSVSVSTVYRWKKLLT